jgi:dihydrodipicolinate synthase/N-acetylneuraminate lyase
MKRPSRNESEQGIRGVVAASLTPRRAGEPVVDLAALLEVIDFLCSAGVQGIVLFGSTGEFVHFGSADRSRALSLAVKRSRCPVYANVAHSNLDSALALADEAASTGAAGVLLTPPIYFRYDQETVRQYYLEFLNALHGMVPAYLYNIPAFCAPISVETAASLIAAGYAGIKDSSGDADYFARLVEACAASPGARLVTGIERIYGRFRGAGASGIVSGAASAVPELLVAYERALCGGCGGTGCAVGRVPRGIHRMVRGVPRPDDRPGSRKAARLAGGRGGRSARPAVAEARRRVSRVVSAVVERRERRAVSLTD